MTIEELRRRLAKYLGIPEHNLFVSDRELMRQLLDNPEIFAEQIHYEL